MENVLVMIIGKSGVLVKECNHNFATFLFSSILSQNRRRDPLMTYILLDTLKDCSFENLKA